jgi:hypothetical protein
VPEAEGPGALLEGVALAEAPRDGELVRLALGEWTKEREAVRLGLGDAAGERVALAEGRPGTHWSSPANTIS